jgi:hypothetical protein
VLGNRAGIAFERLTLAHGQDVSKVPRPGRRFIEATADQLLDQCLLSGFKALSKPTCLERSLRPVTGETLRPRDPAGLEGGLGVADCPVRKFCISGELLALLGPGDGRSG